MGIFLQFCVKTMAWDTGTEHMISWLGQQSSSDEEFGYPWVSRLLEFDGKSAPKAGESLSHHPRLPWDRQTACGDHPFGS